MRRVERAAWNTIVRCTRAEKLTTLPLPVPVEQWVEGPLGITFGVTEMEPPCLGKARPTKREIDVSSSLVGQEARFRFTIAHELGHVVLHPRLRAEFREMADGDYVERKIEVEANRFAAAFLMPLPALASELSRVLAKSGTDPTLIFGAARESDNGALRLLSSQVIPYVTRRFGVSLTAAARRFADVQLPSGEPLLSWSACMQLVPPESVRELARLA